MHAPTVEAVVALSIVFLAVELVQAAGGRAGLTSRRPWLVPFAFGLLHGFAFAGALAEIGLPRGEIALSLLLFNLGVEIGQLLFIAAVLAASWIVSRHPWPLPAWLRLVPPYAVGAFAAVLVHRAAAAVIEPITGGGCSRDPIGLQSAEPHRGDLKPCESC